VIVARGHIADGTSPLLEVVVDLPDFQRAEAVREEGPPTGMSVPQPRRAVAVVDTGAERTCISSSLANQMKLLPMGAHRVLGVSALHGVSTARETIVRACTLRIGDREHFVRALEIEPYRDDASLLLGWDVLGAYRVVFDGPNREFWLADERPQPARDAR
jgi:hypothetical protein